MKGMKQIRLFLSIVISAVLAFPNAALAASVDNAGVPQLLSDELSSGEYSAEYCSEIEEFKVDGVLVESDETSTFTPEQEIEFSWVNSYYREGDTPIVEIQVFDNQGQTSVETNMGASASIALSYDEGVYSFSYTPDSTVDSFRVNVWASTYDWFKYDDENEFCIEIFSSSKLSFTLFDDILTQQEKDDGYPMIVTNSYGDKKVVYPNRPEISQGTIGVQINGSSKLEVLNVGENSYVLEDLDEYYDETSDSYLIELCEEGTYLLISAEFGEDESGDEGGESGEFDEHAGLYSVSYSTHYDDESGKYSGEVKANGKSVSAGEFDNEFTVDEEIEFTLYSPSDCNETPQVHIYAKGKDGEYTTLSSEAGGEISIVDKGNHYSFNYTPDSTVSHFEVAIMWSEFEAFDWCTTDDDVIFIISKDGLSVTLYDSLLTQKQKDDGYPKKAENAKYIKYAYPIEYRYEDIEISIDEDAVFSRISLNSIDLSVKKLISDYGFSGGKFTITPTAEMYGCDGANRSIQIDLRDGESEGDFEQEEGKFDIYIYTAVSGNSYREEGKVIYEGDTVESDSVYEFTADEKISLKLIPPANRDKEIPYVYIEETLLDESFRYCFSVDDYCHTEFKIKKERSGYVLNYLPTDDIKYFSINIFWSRYDSVYVNPDTDICIEIISEGVNTTVYDKLLNTDEREDYPRTASNAYGERKYVYPNRLINEPIRFNLESGYELTWIGSSGSYFAMSGEDYMALHGLGNGAFEVIPTQEMYEDSFGDNRLVLFISTHKHTVVKDKAIAATCITNGKTEGSHCSTCGKVLKAQSTVKATGHTLKENKLVKATTKADGVKAYYSCTKCSKFFEDKACKKSIGDSKALATWKKKAGLIPRAYVIFETATAAYTGKDIKPDVKIVDVNGKAIAKSNYTVTYKNNKKVGQASATVAFKGDYSGSTTYKFNICKKLPTAVNGLKAKAGKAKEVTLTWKKADKSVSGFEIQYSLDKNFVSGVKTVSAKVSATSANIKKLTSKQTYYIRMRSKGKDGKTTTYSAWSKAVKVTVK